MPRPVDGWRGRHLDYHEGAGFFLGFACMALGLLFGVQAARVRFVAGKDSFEILKKPWNSVAPDDELGALEYAGDNVVVGGTNRWRYSAFTNYEFFPKGWVDMGLPPILIYFKETQTPQKGARGPGKVLSDLSQRISPDAAPGQVHFAPAMCDCRLLKAAFEAKGCRKVE